MIVEKIGLEEERCKWKKRGSFGKKDGVML